jgi:dTDP-3-amino-3,4,6-trideoxy-alpha-D-glucose transaminase
VSGQREIRFADLSRGLASRRSELEAAIAEVLDSGRLILGEQCQAFEREFAAACGVRHAIGVASGTDAIELALRAVEIGPGDEVVTQANTCVPTVAAIARAGATPVLCDVELEGGTMDPQSLREALSDRTRAIVPVHLYGQCANMDALLEIARERGVAILEDCAQAHGALFRHRHAGSFGTIGCFSFYPTKNLAALGDAGALVTNDERLADRLRLIRQYGQTDRYHHVMAGVNSRLDELQAAVLRVKLPHLERANARRASIAATYSAALENTPVRPLELFEGRRHAFHLFVTRAPERVAFQRELRERGVGTLIHYPTPVHGHPPYRSLGGRVPLANSERLAREVVSLPLYPELTDVEVETVATAARESALRGGRIRLRR